MTIVYTSHPKSVHTVLDRDGVKGTVTVLAVLHESKQEIDSLLKQLDEVRFKYLHVYDELIVTTTDWRFCIWGVDYDSSKPEHDNPWYWRGMFFALLDDDDSAASEDVRSDLGKAPKDVSITNEDMEAFEDGQQAMFIALEMS